MESMDRTLPAAMQDLHKKLFDVGIAYGFEFELYEQFYSREDTDEWFRLWTGNAEADGSVFRIFGQDGSGGYAAFWLVRDNQDILRQPIVFLGSEGEIGVVARNFSDYLWLLANNCGPAEAIMHSGDESSAHAGLMEFARQHAATPEGLPDAIIQRAKSEFPDFESYISSLCR